MMGQQQVDGVIVWSLALALGEPEIDRQHQRWVALLNEFINAVNDGKEIEATYKCLLAVLEYTERHFEAEEALMRKMGYAFANEHAMQHDSATEEIRRFNLAEEEPEQMIAFFRTFLPRWIMYHICVADRMAFDQIQGRSPRQVGFHDAHAMAPC